eukprot:126195-Chlamydomonas_euryale.AAC.13
MAHRVAGCLESNSAFHCQRHHNECIVIALGMLHGHPVHHNCARNAAWPPCGCSASHRHAQVGAAPFPRGSLC